MSGAREFNLKILRAIEKGLEPIGETATRSLYLYARRKHGLKRYEIPMKPSEFSHVIREVYGESAGGIERRIIQTIAEDFALGTKPSSLQEAIDLAERTLHVH